MTEKEVAKEKVAEEKGTLSTTETTIEGEPKDPDDTTGGKGTKIREREISRPEQGR